MCGVFEKGSGLLPPDQAASDLPPFVLRAGGVELLRPPVSVAPPEQRKRVHSQRGVLDHLQHHRRKPSTNTGEAGGRNCDPVFDVLKTTLCWRDDTAALQSRPRSFTCYGYASLHLEILKKKQQHLVVTCQSVSLFLPVMTLPVNYSDFFFFGVTLVTLYKLSGSWVVYTGLP